MDSTRYLNVQEMLSCYWLPSGIDEPLVDIAERVKADAAPGEVETILREIAEFLRSAKDELDQAFDAEFVSYCWPRGDGLTARSWLTGLSEHLDSPLDTSKHHWSGAY